MIIYQNTPIDKPPVDNKSQKSKVIIQRRTRVETCNQFQKISTKVLYIISSFMFNIKTEICVNDTNMQLAFHGTTFEEILPIYHGTEEGGFHVILFNLMELSKYNLIIAYLFKVCENKYELNPTKIINFAQNAEETENKMSYKSEDLVVIQNDILKMSGLEYNIKTNTLTIDKSFDLYDVINELLQLNIIELISIQKEPYIMHDNNKIIFNLDYIDKITINTKDKYLPKFIVDLYKSNGINFLQGIIDINEDSMNIIKKLHESMIPQDSNSKKTQDFLSNGIMSTIFKRLGCGFTGEMSKITLSKMNNQEIKELRSQNKFHNLLSLTQGLYKLFSFISFVSKNNNIKSEYISYIKSLMQILSLNTY